MYLSTGIFSRKLLHKFYAQDDSLKTPLLHFLHFLGRHLQINSSFHFVLFFWEGKQKIDFIPTMLAGWTRNSTASRNSPIIPWPALAARAKDTPRFLRSHVGSPATSTTPLCLYVLRQYKWHFYFIPPCHPPQPPPLRLSRPYTCGFHSAGRLSSGWPFRLERVW